MQAKWTYGYHRPVEAVKKLELKNGASLLLVGSGFGKTAIMAARHFKCSVIGAEISPILVDAARRRAEAKGLNDTVRFVLLDVGEPHVEAATDSAFFESILSFLEKPQNILSHCSKLLSPGGRIAVLEPTLLSSTPNQELTNALKEIFGEDADLRDEETWSKIFDSVGLKTIEVTKHRFGLMRKFWDDLREEPLGTFVELGKTLHTVYTDERAKKSMRLFRRFFRECSSSMVCSCYLLERFDNVE